MASFHVIVATLSVLHKVRMNQYTLFKFFEREKNKFMKVEKGNFIVILLRFDDVTTQLEAIEKYQVNMFLPRVTLA